MSKALEAYHKAVRRYREASENHHKALQVRLALEDEVTKAKASENTAFDKWGEAEEALKGTRAKYEDEISKTLSVQ